MTYQEAYRVCAKKARLHMVKQSGKLQEMCASSSGDYYENGENEVSFADNYWTWLASMVTGMASLLLQTDGDLEMLRWANHFKAEYRDKVFRPYTQTMHDIGFLYLPYSVHLYQLTGDTDHRDTALRAADELIKRFNPRAGVIDAWNFMNEPRQECRMIVDTSMNLSLLYWAWQETGHYIYRDVADCHFEKVMRVLIREDYSVAHAWLFDPETGEPTEEINSCGYANGSHWGRGTAWVVFGLAMAYSYTKREDFLEVALKVADKYLESLEDGPVPVWDFRLPEDLPAKSSYPQNVQVPWDESDPANKKFNVDTSAAAVMSCAFLLIDSLVGNEKLRNHADKALRVLAEEYLDTNTEIVGMLRRSNGRDTFTTYGDYYFMLALAMKIYGVKTCWEADGASGKSVAK